MKPGWEGTDSVDSSLLLVVDAKGWNIEVFGTLKTLGSYKLKFPSRAKLCSKKKLLGVESKLNWTPSTPPKKGQRKEKFPMKRTRRKDTEETDLGKYRLFFFLSLCEHIRKESMRTVKSAELSWSTHFT